MKRSFLSDLSNLPLIIGALGISWSGNLAAQVEFDSATGAHNNSVSTFASTLVTIGNNPDRILIVGVSTAASSAAGDSQPVDVEFRGQDMTFLASTIDTLGNSLQRSYLYYTLNPSPGISGCFVQVDRTAAITLHAVSLYNAKQVEPTVLASTPWTDGAGGISCALDTPFGTGMVVGLATIPGGGSASLVPGGNVTLRDNREALGPGNFDDVDSYIGTKPIISPGPNGIFWGMNTGQNWLGTQTAVAIEGIAVVPPVVPAIANLDLDFSTGSGALELTGEPGQTLRLVSSPDLDFNPTQTEAVPLTSVLVGSQVGDHFMTDENGRAAVEFSFETTKQRGFIRAEAP